jgi:putative lipoprotein
MHSPSIQRRTALATVFATALLAACAQGQPSPKAPVNAVTGTVDLRERMALPADAVLVVELQDTSRADAPAPVLAQQSVRLEGLQPPYSFNLPVEPSRINPTGRYTVSARITRGNQLLFTNDTAHSVLTQGAGTRAHLALVRVATP